MFPIRIMDEFLDLPPDKDPMGGSPRTPSVGIPQKAYQQYVNGNGNGTIWKVSTSLLAGLLISLVIAYFTALRGQGISQKDMQEYVDKAIKSERELIATQNQSRDEKIGSLMGHKDRLFTLVELLQGKNVGYDRDLQDHEHKFKLITDYIEAEKTPKR